MNRNALLPFIPAVTWLVATPYLWHVMMLGSEWWRFYYFEAWAVWAIASIVCIAISVGLFFDDD